MRHLIFVVLMAAFAAIGASAVAQDGNQRIVLPSPVMVIDFERVFNETLYGQRVTDELNAERDRVQTNLDQLAAELIEEERALTEARGDMTAEDFQAAADAFDERAQKERAFRETEQSRLVNLLDSERATFIERIQPILNALMIDRGALVAMDRRSVLQAIGSANATEDAIALIDEQLGNGRFGPDERPTLRPDSGLGSTDDSVTLPDLSGSD